MDVVGESSTDKPAARPAQPVTDIDSAGAIPEDNFTQYVSAMLSISVLFQQTSSDCGIL